MEGLFTVQNVAILSGFATFVFWCACRVFAQSDVIAAAEWAAKFSKTPPEQEDV